MVKVAGKAWAAKRGLLKSVARQTGLFLLGITWAAMLTLHTISILDHDANMRAAIEMRILASKPEATYVAWFNEAVFPTSSLCPECAKRTLSSGPMPVAKTIPSVICGLIVLQAPSDTRLHLHRRIALT